jgi:GNAT superfamily N-acetyltransferase
MYFLFTTQSRFRINNLSYHKLTDKPEMLKQAAEWGEKEWGYLRDFPGIEKRKELIKDFKDQFYIVMYGNQPIGMFALVDKPPLYKKLLDKKPSVNLKLMKLTYFYVYEGLRGLGIGTAMLQVAKQIAAEQEATIVLDTLKPNLNSFYQRSGARVLCEDKSLGFPTTLLRMK